MLLLLLSDRVRIGHQLQVERFAVVNGFLVQLMGVLVVVAGTLAVVHRWRCGATVRRSNDSFLLQHDRWIRDLQEGRRRARLEESGPTRKWLIRSGIQFVVVRVVVHFSGFRCFYLLVNEGTSNFSRAGKPKTVNRNSKISTQFLRATRHHNTKL
uniref:(northern house mosquito) hypothetical protein n=1 Tax=Culex pipiens TaxID=7175 RepID=A0A8D8HKN9_CULPI